MKFHKIFLNLLLNLKEKNSIYTFFYPLFFLIEKIFFLKLTILNIKNCFLCSNSMLENAPVVEFYLGKEPPVDMQPVKQT